MTWHYRYRKQIIIGIFLFLLLVAFSSYGLIKHHKAKDKKVTQITNIMKKPMADEIKEKEIQPEETYKVDIKGQVVTPGIYTMKKSSRVIDVINEAGGLTQNANTTVINLSKRIVDEMVIIVYSNEEVENFTKTKELENHLQEKCEQKDATSLKNDACLYSDEDPVKKVISINKATLEELMTLPGIGESKAKEIINYRTNNGEFKSIDELKKIPGIGESIFAKIKENITT